MPPRPRPTVVPWSGEAFRATTYDVPLWVRPNRRDGRWNAAYDGSTQYLSLDSAAPYAEMLRQENLRTGEEARTYRVVLWQLRVDEGSMVDYSTFEKAEEAGFPADALVDDDHERCQAEGKWLKGHNVNGVLSPSAALPGAINLTLFGPRSSIDWTTRVQLASTVAVQRLSEGSAPPGLVERVRFFGEAHPSLVAFRGGS